MTADASISCPACGYALTGLLGATCPECGAMCDRTALAAIGAARAHRRRRWLVVTAVVAALLSIANGIGSYHVFRA